MKEKLLILIWFLFLPVFVSRAETEFGGIYYNITGEEAEVTHGANVYSGAVVIPSTITYNGKPYSVTSIGSQAFKDCKDLTSVAIPESVTSIGYQAFRNCSALTTITTPSSVTNIANGAFYGCSGLTSANILGNVTAIGWNTFGQCQSLTSFTIPESVTSIGEYAFYNCSSLSQVTSKIKTPFTTDFNAFDGIPSDATLYVPAGTEAQYRALADWNRFANILPIPDVEHDYNWSIGPGGNFADIYTAMHDSRVKDGDVLQILKGTNLTGNSYITKAVTIVGNGYMDTSDGYVNNIYLEKDNITLKNLYTGSIYLRAHNATIERCRANGISGSTGYEADDVTIRGCFVLGPIRSYNSAEVNYGWNISNNIIINFDNNSNTLDYLEEATIDHNLIISYVSEYYAVGDVKNSSFTNNILLEPTNRHGISNAAVNSATKFEYNIVSNSGSFANWPTNQTGSTDMQQLFNCNGERTTDAYYTLDNWSPAKGYANDGGDCGPWTGTFPYVLHYWKLNPVLTTNPERFEFATLESMIDYLLNNRNKLEESVTVKVADATYNMDMLAYLLDNNPDNNLEFMLQYIAKRVDELIYKVVSAIDVFEHHGITISMEAPHATIFNFNIQNDPTIVRINELLQIQAAEWLAQGMSQEEVTGRLAEYRDYLEWNLKYAVEAIKRLADFITLTNITIYIDGKPYPADPTHWELDPTLTTNTESYEFATLESMIDYLINNGNQLEESVTVNVADATYNMDVLAYLLKMRNYSLSDPEALLKSIFSDEVWLKDWISDYLTWLELENITFSMEAPHAAIFNFNIKNDPLIPAILTALQARWDELGMSQEEVTGRLAEYRDYLDKYQAYAVEAIQRLADFITLTNITIYIDGKRYPYIPIPRGEIDPDDLLALKNIYNMLGGSSWTSKKWKVIEGKYDNEYIKDDFPGVTFDDEGYVVQIDLSNNNLRGSVNATDWIWQLGMPRLTGLYMQQNNISGDLSPWLNGENRGNRLKALNMSYNNLTQISDTIPSSITSLILNNQNREWFRPDGVSIDPLKIEAMANLKPIRLYLSAMQTVAIPSLFSYDRVSQEHSARPTMYIINETGMDKYGYFTSSSQDTYSLAWKDGEYTEKQDAPCYVRFGNPFDGSVYPAYLRYINGDANMSGYTDVLDVQTTLNYVLTDGGVWQFNRTAANTYDDNIINVQDIVCMVNIVLSNEAVADSIILSQSSSRRLSRAADDADVQGWLYNQQGRIMLTAANEVGAIDVELKGVTTSQVSLLLNHSQFQMIGRDTEKGSRYIIFSPTGQPIPSSEDVPLLAVSAQTELLAAQASDMEAQDMALAIGQPTGLAQVLGGALNAAFQGDDLVVTIATDIQDLSLRLYSTGGQVVLQSNESSSARGELRLQAPVTPGAYILEMTTRQGGRKIVKLLKR